MPSPRAEKQTLGAMKVAEFKMTAAVAVHPRPKLSVSPGSLESRDTTFTENDIFFLFWVFFPKDKLENFLLKTIIFQEWLP